MRGKRNFLFGALACFLLETLCAGCARQQVETAQNNTIDSLLAGVCDGAVSLAEPHSMGK